MRLTIKPDVDAVMLEYVATWCHVASQARQLLRAQVLEMLEKGETPPGIRTDIQDSPPNPSQPPPPSSLAPRSKPWERNSSQPDEPDKGESTAPGVLLNHLCILAARLNCSQRLCPSQEPKLQSNAMAC